MEIVFTINSEVAPVFVCFRDVPTQLNLNIACQTELYSGRSLVCRMALKRSGPPKKSMVGKTHIMYFKSTMLPRAKHQLKNKQLFHSVNLPN